MRILILNNNTNEQLFEITGLRKNTTHKTIIEKIKQNILNIYEVSVSKLIPTGTIDFVTGQQNISYVIFGENTNRLPTRNIKIIKEA